MKHVSQWYNKLLNLSFVCHMRVSTRQVKLDLIESWIRIEEAFGD